MNNRITAWLYQKSRQFRSAAPYLAVALVVPGGSVFALLAWLYHNKQGKL
jgi:hypothetical protein